MPYRTMRQSVELRSTISRIGNSSKFDCTRLNEMGRNPLQVAYGLREAVPNPIVHAIKVMDMLIDEHRPAIGNEIYLTGEEVCGIFGISKRSLQTYREERIAKRDIKTRMSEDAGSFG